MLVNVLIGFGLSKRLSGSAEAAFLATFLWAQHPALYQLLFNSGTIYEILCFLFYFAALSCYAAWRTQSTLSWRRIAMVLALDAMALNSKEMAVTLPVFVLIWELAHGRRRVRQPPQRGPIWRRDLLRQRRLEYRHRLTQLRCPAPELAQGREHLLGGAGGYLVGSSTGQPTSGRGRAGSMAQRQHSQPAGTPERTGRHDRSLLAPHCCSQRPLLTPVSVGHLDHPPSDACLNGWWPGVGPGCASTLVLTVVRQPREAGPLRHTGDAAINY